MFVKKQATINDDVLDYTNDLEDRIEVGFDGNYPLLNHPAVKKNMPITPSATANFTNILTWGELQNMQVYEIEIVLRGSDDGYVAYGKAIIVRFNNSIRLNKIIESDSSILSLAVSGSLNLQVVTNRNLSSNLSVMYRPITYSGL